MTNIQIRIEDGLKEQAGAVAREMGIDLSAAIRLFLTQMVRENGLPFRPNADPFFSRENKKVLKNSIEQIERGEVVSKNIDDLLGMEG